MRRLKVFDMKWSRNDRTSMKNYYDHFSLSNYLDLDENSKNTHSMDNCAGCISSSHHEYSALIPVKSRRYEKTKNLNKKRAEKENHAQNIREDARILSLSKNIAGGLHCLGNFILKI